MNFFHLYLAPRRGWPCRNFVKMFDAGKIRMIWLPYSEKNYDDMLSRFHLIPERYKWMDGRTDRQTDRFAISISRISILCCWRAIKNHCFLILQGSVLTHARWSETFWYAEMRYSFLVNLMQKLSKLVNICKSCCKKFIATLFMPHNVYIAIRHNPRSWIRFRDTICDIIRSMKNILQHS